MSLQAILRRRLEYQNQQGTTNQFSQGNNLTVLTSSSLPSMIWQLASPWDFAGFQFLTCASLNVSWPYQETIKLHQLPHTHIFLGLDGCFPLNPFPIFPAVPDSPVVPERDPTGIPPTPATMVMIRRSAWLLALLLSAGISVFATSSPQIGWIPRGITEQGEVETHFQELNIGNSINI